MTRRAAFGLIAAAFSGTAFAKWRNRHDAQRVVPTTRGLVTSGWSSPDLYPYDAHVTSRSPLPAWCMRVGAVSPSPFNGILLSNWGIDLTDLQPGECVTVADIVGVAREQGSCTLPLSFPIPYFAFMKSAPRTGDVITVRFVPRIKPAKSAPSWHAATLGREARTETQTHTS